ncbi:MFS transporter [Prescottella equi]|uniref:MFS transporter n=1 Tax=Rhodococcus hoagii TaxID=43767 RepID=UPI003556BC7A
MRRTSAALFLVGVATFAPLNAPQSILCLIGQDLGLNPARAALVTTASTAGLAVGVLPWIYTSDRVDRYWALISSATLSAATGMVVRALPTFEAILVGRVAEGMMLAGVPVTAITYASERLPGKCTAKPAGFFVGGATVGGLAGRLISSTTADLSGWRAGLFASSAFSTAVVILFLFVAPRRAYGTHPPRASDRGRWKPLATPRQAAMYAQGFLLTGAFFALYNYIGFRLGRDPFNLSQQQIGLTYGAYLAGTCAALAAGSIVGVVGRRPVLLVGTGAIFLGGAATLASSLWIFVCGLALATAGFFGAHSVVAGWVGSEVSAGTRASSLYTLAYYGGASLFGWLGGEAYQSYSWPGLVGGIMLLTIIAAILSLILLPGGGQQADIVRKPERTLDAGTSAPREERGENKSMTN